MAEITFEITKELGVISENAKGWTRELNLVSWNEREPKYDIRDWNADHSRMSKGISMTEEKKAVAAGYWHNFRFDSCRADNGENPFQLDSKAPSASYRDFIMGEVRYNSLTRAFPKRAEELFAKAEKFAAEKYEKFSKMAE